MKTPLLPITYEHLNAETPLDVLLAPVTPVESFYKRNHFPIPQLTADEWRLQIHGVGVQPQTLTLADIQALPAKTIDLVLECAGNGRKSMQPPPAGVAWNLGAVSRGRFRGAPLAALLDRLELAPGVAEVQFTGADHGAVRSGAETAYARSLTLAQARHPDVLLAWEMNGAPLTPEHGFPLRLIVPDWYGMAAVKWLTEITFLAHTFAGFFQVDDYVFVGEPGLPNGAPATTMWVRALLLSPLDGVVCEYGPIEMRGVAWVGEGEVSRVDLSFDGGATWQATALDNPSGAYTAQPWRFTWNPARPGEVEILVRATDSAGNSQPLQPRGNKGGYGNNSVQRVKFTIR